MDREVWVEAQVVGSADGETEVVRDGPGRWRGLPPLRRLALAAIVSASVAAIAVVGAVLSGLPVSVATGDSPIAAIVASPGATGATGTKGVTSTTDGSSSSSTSSTGAGATTSTTAAGSAIVASSNGASTTSTSAGPSGPIRDVDLRNFAYPASLCPQVPSHDGVMAVRDGYAGVSIVGYVPDDPSTFGHGAMVEEAVYADVTGDGVDDAVVPVYCYEVPGYYDTIGEGYDRNLAIVSSTPAGAAVVATLGDASVTHAVTDETGARDVTYGYAMAARAEAGDLVVDWFEGLPGARYKTTVTHRFDGGSFVAVGDTGALDSWSPAAPPAPSPHGTSILRFDPFALTLPLSDGRTCGPQFADLGPLADAHLDSGKVYDDGVTRYDSDDVVTADGRATDAHVFVSSAITKELTAPDGRNELDLVVTVGCVRGSTVTTGVLVLRDAPDRPEVIGWVFGPAAVPGAQPWVWQSNFEDDGQLVIDWHDPSGVVTVQALQWDGTAFVDVVSGAYCHLS